MSKNYFPLITVPHEQLNDTPLQNLQMRQMNKEDDLSMVYDELYEYGILGKHQTAQFTKRLPEFIRNVNEIMQWSRVEANVWNTQSGAEQLRKDAKGYYLAVIEQKRAKNEKFCCYKIKGQIAEPPDGDEAASDWLFYWKNVFPDLEVGDMVKFKTTKSEIKVFRDVGRARNLYPDDLKKVEPE